MSLNVYIMKERKQIIKIDSCCFISAHICVKVLVVVNSYKVFSVDDICRLIQVQHEQSEPQPQHALADPRDWTGPIPPPPPLALQVQGDPPQTQVPSRPAETLRNPAKESSAVVSQTIIARTKNI
jgi:hypothetical protein